ncbi:unnamed protein product, partial [Discosporangium mesarthrocarpum]
RAAAAYGGGGWDIEGGVELPGREGPGRGPGPGSGHHQELGCVQVVRLLALAHMCCRHVVGRRVFSTGRTVQALLRLVLEGGVEERSWALQLCRSVLPEVEPGVVDREFRAIAQQRDPSYDVPFVESLLGLIGKTTNVWGRYHGVGGAGDGTGEGRALAMSTLSPPVDFAGGVGGRARQEGVRRDMLGMLMSQKVDILEEALAPAKEAFSLASELVSLLHDLVARGEGGSEGGTEPMAPKTTKQQSGQGKRMGGTQKDNPSHRHWSTPMGATHSVAGLWAEEMVSAACKFLSRAPELVADLGSQKRMEEKLMWVEASRARRLVSGLALTVPSDVGEMVEMGLGLEPGLKNSSSFAAGRVDEVAGGVGEGPGLREWESLRNEYADGEKDQEGGSLLSGGKGAQLQEKHAHLEDMDCVLAALCLMGGQFRGLCPGSTVLYHPEAHRSPPAQEASAIRGGRGRTHNSSSPPGLEGSSVPAEEATVLSLGLCGGETAGMGVAGWPTAMIVRSSVRGSAL